MGHFSIDFTNPKDIKRSMQATWKDIDSKESDSTTSKDAWYEQNDFLAFVVSLNFVHDSDCDCTNEQNVAYLNNLVVEHDNLIKR